MEDAPSTTKNRNSWHRSLAGRLWLAQRCRLDSSAGPAPLPFSLTAHYLETPWTSNFSFSNIIWLNVGEWRPTSANRDVRIRRQWVVAYSRINHILPYSTRLSRASSINDKSLTPWTANIRRSAHLNDRYLGCIRVVHFAIFASFTRLHCTPDVILFVQQWTPRVK